MKCEEIRDKIADYMDLDICLKSRKTPYIKARALFYHFASRFSSDCFSKSSIAEKVNKDHAGMINGLKCHESYMISDSHYRMMHNELEAFFRGEDVKSDEFYNGIKDYSKIELENKYRSLNMRYNNLSNRKSEVIREQKKIIKDLKIEVSQLKHELKLARELNIY